jgi:oligopeptide transport system ATP-binding protein
VSDSATQPHELLAEWRDVRVHFPVRKGLLFAREVGRVRAVDGVSLGLRRGQVLGLVGESGSGKSTTGRALLRLAPITAGSVWFAGQDITRLDRKGLLPIRRRLQVVFQDPEASLNPRMRIGDAVAEPLRIHARLTPAQTDRKVAELLEQVGLDPQLRTRWPHEFSGGQRQRVGIARALATEPELIVLDEPISALDVSIQAQVLNLLADLRQRLGLSYLFIAHDLAAVAHLCDDVAVLYLGRVVEHGPAHEVFRRPAHPYTRALLASIPLADPVLARQREPAVLQGEIPSPMNPPSGCAFHPRCPFAQDRCLTELPLLRPIETTRAACHFAEQLPALP